MKRRSSSQFWLTTTASSLLTASPQYHGLTLDGSKGELAAWLCDLADGMGEPERALEAAIVAFRATLSLSAYLRVHELAGERWPELREDLVAYLRQVRPFHPQGPVDIFLHEGLVDDAIAAVKENGGYDLLERVMDAAVEHRPDWVIQVARRQAGRIMDAGQAKYYHHAVNWLERAHAAYRAAGREADWRTYLAETRTRHGRKHKLMGMLKRSK